MYTGFPNENSMRLLENYTINQLAIDCSSLIPKTTLPEILEYEENGITDY